MTETVIFGTQKGQPSVEILRFRGASVRFVDEKIALMRWNGK